MAAAQQPSLLRVVTTRKKRDVVTWKLEVYDGMFHHFQVITAHKHGRISSRTMHSPKARISCTLNLRIRWSIIRRANRSRERTVMVSRSVRRRNTRLWKYVIDFAPNNFRFRMQESLTRFSRWKALFYIFSWVANRWLYLSLIFFGCIHRYSFNKEATRAYKIETSSNLLLSYDMRIILYLSFME